MQQTARRSSVAVDSLQWEFIVDPATVQPDTIVVRGMTLEGASWDVKNGCLCEPRTGELSTNMPPILFRAIEGKKKSTTKATYNCPVYYYPVRSGTRERPSFVIAVDLKTGSLDSEFFVKRGTALTL